MPPALARQEGAPGGALLPEPILAVSGLTKRFGGLVAVNDVSFQVNEGTATGIIGPNGAGKTTVFGLISGFETPTAGRILFRGAEIQGRAAHIISRHGVGRTFQTVRVCHELTVRDNLRVADLYSRDRGEGSFAERAAAWLEFVGLQGHVDARAQALSYGQQKLLELAMVLMTGPSLLLLDEPVAGVNPVMIAKMEALFAAMVGRGLTLLIVEHNVPFVVACCSTVIVMSDGRVLAQGPGSVIQQDERVLDVFLGGR